MVPRRIVNSTVQDALHDSRWIRDIHGEASAMIFEFLRLWSIVSDISSARCTGYTCMAMDQFRAVHSKICV
jgi:hypothetical protein